MLELKKSSICPCILYWHLFSRKIWKSNVFLISEVLLYIPEEVGWIVLFEVLLVLDVPNCALDDPLLYVKNKTHPPPT